MNQISPPKEYPRWRKKVARLTAEISEKHGRRQPRRSHQLPLRPRFDHTADVVIVGAGASGLPAAIMARDHGASVIVIDANHDIGGHAMLSGGRIP